VPVASGVFLVPPLSGSPLPSLSDVTVCISLTYTSTEFPVILLIASCTALIVPLSLTSISTGASLFSELIYSYNAVSLPSAPSVLISRSGASLNAF